MDPDDLRQMLFGLASRFKTLGVTSYFTLEAQSLHSSEWSLEQGFSPIADNLIMMRYEPAAGAYRPYIAVIKSRGSGHESGRYEFMIEHGGAKVGKSVYDNSPHPGEKGSSS